MRDRVLSVSISSLFLLVCLGLFYTQVIRYPYYSRLSRNNSIRVIPIDGPRGNIFDRNGNALVTNRMSFNVVIIYQELRGRTRLIRLLKDMLGMSGSQIAESLEKAGARPYIPFAIAEDIDKEKAIAFEEEIYGLDGVTVQTRSRRDYLYKNTGSHLFGYLSEIGEGELEDLRDSGYRVKDKIGRSGLEKYYETYLRGVDGGTQIEVDSRGRQTRVLGVKEPLGGKDLYLTIDLSIQSICDKLLGNHVGAIVVINPLDGEVLAIASHPSFDPNIFVKPNTSGQRLRLLKDRIGRPMSSRAISGLYPPGSIFKIVTASAALETREIGHNTYFVCLGSFKLGRGKFDCWKKDGHGSLNIQGGLMNSCNVFFYNAGRLAGVDAIEHYAKLFGYGNLTGIDLPDEVKGIVPGRNWKRIYRRGNWYEGETINYAIGQGYLAVTPIQAVNMMAVIANNGSLVKPYIVRKIDATPIAPEKRKKIELKNETMNEIRRGLYEVVNNENGTGKRAKTEGVAVAGKTGTAQNPRGRTHAWFTGYAPYNNPKICLVVFLEHGGKGGVEPAEIARGIFEEAKRIGYL
ncbi:MAG: penicillin-binding protein 2 [Candidatus Omnitrophota bacterium]|nr:penicillin-binding protein 2 [Candidatus Omnitrophota bacterium]